MRDKLEDYHENDLAEVFPELTLTERREGIPHSRYWDAFRYF